MTTSPMPTTRTKVLLVDDHDLIRKGLRHAFERDRQFEVVGEAATAAEGVRQAGALQPDVVIMDLNLTTAASVWYSAAIGMAIGFNFYIIALAAVIFAVAVPRIPHISKIKKDLEDD